MGPEENTSAQKIQLSEFTNQIAEYKNKLLEEKNIYSNLLNTLNKILETEKMASNYIGMIENYNAEEDDWSQWHERLEQFFAANDVKPEKKLSLLITLIGKKGYSLLKDLCLPDAPSSKTYETITTLMKNHQQPAPNPISERYKFKQCSQLENEDIKSFTRRLNGLATYCEFKDELKNHLRDQFVWGIRDEAGKRKLLSETKLTYDAAVQIATARETTSKDAAAMKADAGASSTSVNYFKTKTQEEQQLKCFCCGRKNHIAPNCRYRDSAVCKKCQGKGHFENVCNKSKNNNKSGNSNNNNKNNKGRKQSKNRSNNNHNKNNKNENQNFLTETETLYETTDDFYSEPADGTTDDFFCMKQSNKSDDKKYFLKFEVNKINTKFEMDTGSPITAISEEYYNKHFKNCNITPTNRTFRSYIGHAMIPCGIISPIAVKYGNSVHNLQLFIMPGDSDPIVGRDWLRAFKVIDEEKINACFINKIDDEQAKLAREFPNVFSNKLGTYKGRKFEIHLKENCKPIYKKAHPVPYAFRGRIEAELDRLEREGVISKVESSEWATPIVAVVKKNGAIRICGNYRLTINRYMEIDRHPVPRVQDLLATQGKNIVQTKLDLVQAYQQALVHHSSKFLTTISTHKGLYVCNRMMFGIASGPGWFQREMERHLGDIPGVTLFFDDVRVGGKNKKEHDERLREVLRRLDKLGLTVRIEKCEIAKEKIKFLGYELDSKGVHVSKEKVEAIAKISAPTNVKELQVFLGMMNYYSKFIKNYASIVSPLYELLNKNRKWVWSRKCDNAFRQAKESLASREVLMFYDMQLPVKITCDASPSGLGAVLSHVLPNNSAKPVAYASRALNKAEKNYAQIDREALGIVFAVKTFHQYLYGRHFEIETDHKPLIFIFGDKKGIPQMAASRVQRWAVFLSGYDFSIKHIKGKDNCLADCLSRMPTTEQDTSDDSADDYTYLNFIDESIPLISLNTVKKETDNDKNLRQIREFIKNGWPNKVDDIFKSYKCRANELTIENDCVMYGHRLIAPVALRENLLKELHTAHMGIVRMKAIARSYIWWPGIDKEIENITKKCTTCLENASNPPKTKLHVWDWPEAPNERIHIDFLGPVNGRMYMVILDAHSKWADVKIMKNITSEITIEALRDYFVTWGLPGKLVSDNGPSLVSERFENFLSNYGIKHVTIAPYHAASNGAAENLVKTFKSKLKLLIIDKIPTKEAMQKFLFHYRSTPHCTTGVSPAELQIGRKFKTRLDFLKIAVKNRVEGRQSDQRKYFRGNNNKSFEIGDIVMAKDFRNNAWRKSIIFAKEGNVTYFVKTISEGLKWKRHVDQLLSCDPACINDNNACTSSNNKNTPIFLPEIITPDNDNNTYDKNKHVSDAQTIINDNNNTVRSTCKEKSDLATRNSELCDETKNMYRQEPVNPLDRVNNNPQITIRRSSRSSKGIAPNKLNL